MEKDGNRVFLKSFQNKQHTNTQLEMSGIVHYPAPTTWGLIIGFCYLQKVRSFVRHVIKRPSLSASSSHTACSALSQCHPPPQILKLYAWEPSFQAQVEGIREEELKVMKKFSYLNSISTFIFSCAPALVSAVRPRV